MQISPPTQQMQPLLRRRCRVPLLSLPTIPTVPHSSAYIYSPAFTLHCILSLVASSLFLTFEAHTRGHGTLPKVLPLDGPSHLRDPTRPEPDRKKRKRVCRRRGGVVCHGRRPLPPASLAGGRAIRAVSRRRAVSLTRLSEPPLSCPTPTRLAHG
ncbi:hypothetical protein BKA81DRAFT_348539, partial [Phyllosticta paracitricarpa]